MNIKTEIFVGHPIEIESEMAFLRQLSSDLEASGRRAVIFANFFPRRKPEPQIDFLVVLDGFVCHVELKCVSCPIFGGTNGAWHILMPDGSRPPLQYDNPYGQSTKCKFAISDEMRAFTGQDKAAKPFFKQMQSVLCIYPKLHSHSDVVSDYKVKTIGYPELLRLLLSGNKSPGWSFEEWIEFAMYLGLVRQDDRSPAQIAADDDAQVLETYLQRFQEWSSIDSQQHVPTSLRIDDEELSTEDLISKTDDRQHFQLIGPSGHGKSMLLRGLGAQLSTNKHPVILASAVKYQGRLSDLLNRSVSHLCPMRAIEFIELALRRGVTPTIFVDGFNECPARLRTQLLTDLQALFVHYGTQIAMSSQQRVELPSALSGAVIEFQELTDEQRVAILEQYVGRAVTKQEIENCVAFRSGYELSIAAECLSQLGESSTRRDLFNRFLERRFDSPADVIWARQVFGGLAARMQAQLRTSLSSSDLTHVFESVSGREKIPPRLLNEIVSSGVIDMDQGQCGFRHEMLQRFFESEAICRAVPSFEMLKAELRKPVHHALIEFAIDRQSDNSNIRDLLGLACETNGPSVLSRAFDGNFGASAKQIVRKDAAKMLRDAEADLVEIDFKIEIDKSDGERTSLEPTVLNARQWSSYEYGLMNLVAERLPSGWLIVDVLRLVGMTQSRVNECLELRYRAEVIRKPSVKTVVFSRLCVLGGRGDTLPMSTILRASCDRYSSFEADLIPEPVYDVVRSPTKYSPAELYFALVQFRWNVTQVEDRLTDFFRVCWESEIYHLQLEVLYRVAYWCNITEPYLSELKNYLVTVQPSHPFHGAPLIEALTAFELFENPTSADELKTSLLHALETPDDEESQTIAHDIVSGMFDTINDEACYNAVASLSESERYNVYVMAALGMPSYSMNGGWLLGTLLENVSTKALPAFEKYSRTLDHEAMGPQDRTACFITAHAGSATLVEEPFCLDDLSNDARRAWQKYGELIFWFCKPDISQDELRERSEPILAELSTELAFEAIDPLREFAHASSMTFKSDHGTIVNRLFKMFLPEFRYLLEFGFKNRERLSRLDKRSLDRQSPRELTTFIVHALGRVGDADSATLISELINDPYHGRDVVDAVRRINANEGFEAIGFLHRHP